MSLVPKPFHELLKMISLYHRINVDIVGNHVR